MKIYYYFDSNKSVNNWGLTDNHQLAQEQGKTECRLATLEDLNDLICASGEYFTGEVEVQEGVFLYAEIVHRDELNPEMSYTSGEYIRKKELIEAVNNALYGGCR